MAAKTTPVAEIEWRKFRDKVIPKGSGDIQIAESRLTYLSGMMMGYLMTSEIAQKEELGSLKAFEQEMMDELRKYTGRNTINVLRESERLWS